VSRGVSVSRIERKVRAILGVAGSAILPDIGDYVGGLVTIEADRPEWGFAGGEARYGWHVAAAAGGAANISVLAVVNPVDSGYMAIVEDLFAATILAQNNLFLLSWLASSVFTGGGSGQRDTRQRDKQGALPQFTGAVRFTGRNDAAPAVLVGNGLGLLTPIRVPGGAAEPSVGRLAKPVMIEPGFALVASPVSVDLLTNILNLGISGSAMWRTVPLEGSIAG
jgi:hypothetical protein